MMFLKLFLITLPIFLTIDFIWLGIIAKNIYREQLGFIMADNFRIVPIILFYCLYTAGLVFFTIIPALKESSSWATPLLHGCFFGLICYATYDLTNLATLKNWPVTIVVYDLLWGTFISGITSLIAYTIGTHWKNFFI